MTAFELDISRLPCGLSEERVLICRQRIRFGRHICHVRTSERGADGWRSSPIEVYGRVRWPFDDSTAGQFEKRDPRHALSRAPDPCAAVHRSSLEVAFTERGTPVRQGQQEALTCGCFDDPLSFDETFSGPGGAVYEESPVGPMRFGFAGSQCHFFAARERGGSSTFLRSPCSNS